MNVVSWSFAVYCALLLRSVTGQAWLIEGNEFDIIKYIVASRLCLHFADVTSEIH